MLAFNVGVPPVYPLIPYPNKEQLAQQVVASQGLDSGFKSFLQVLQDGFNTAQPNQQMPEAFYNAMFSMQSLITAVWAAGAVPSFPTE